MYLNFLSISALLFLPMIAQAHGGFQKQAGETTVYITQNPISPFVGEKVSLTFVLKDAGNTNLQNTKILIKVVDTFYGDESKDKVIHTEQKQTDFNGAFSFEYIFDREDYFDIDLEFTDPKTKQLVNTGFLIQPRERTGQKNIPIGKIILIGTLIFVIGLIVGLNARKYKTT